MRRLLLFSLLLFLLVAPLAMVVLISGSPASGTSDASPSADLHVPPQYRALIQRAAATCPGLPELVLAAQLQTESTWNPGAHSPAGALGLAQFLPGTWATWGVDGDDDGRADPLDPADAISSAAQYDCYLFNRIRPLGGDPIELMLAAYNAGPGAVLTAGGMPQIPETQQYVQKILALAGLTTTVGKSGCVAPLHGVLTQPYGGPTGHPGIDLAAPVDTPVFAACTGTVVWAQWTTGYGQYIQIQQRGGTVTAYGHLNQLDVSVGQTVTAGAVIGIEGSTGDSTGPHLHFEVRTGIWGPTQDPLAWLRSLGITL
jgi:murein DD-endopeptidase MepM/ murein hydrolase activator NlpD